MHRLIALCTRRRVRRSNGFLYVVLGRWSYESAYGRLASQVYEWETTRIQNYVLQNNKRQGKEHKGGLL